MFLRYGFREFATEIEDAVAGKLHRLLFVLDDLDYLAKIRSPFLALARGRQISPQARPWLSQIFCDFENRHVDC